MKRILLPLLVVLGLATIAAAGWWLKRPVHATEFACPDPLAGCTFDHAGARAAIQFSRTPVPLEAFVFSVRAPNAKRVSAEFQMVGMDMGFNRYDFRPSAGGFSARITLPVCVSGRHDWMVYLYLDGVRYAMLFESR